MTKNGRSSELENELWEHLEEKGLFAGMRSRIRADMLKAVFREPMDRKDYVNSPDDDQPPPFPPPVPPESTLLLNGLVEEYLRFSGYHNTLNIFQAETGQPGKAMQTENLLSHDKSLMSNALKLSPSSNHSL